MLLSSSLRASSSSSLPSSSSTSRLPRTITQLFSTPSASTSSRSYTRLPRTSSNGSIAGPSTSTSSSLGRGQAQIEGGRRSSSLVSGSRSGSSTSSLRRTGGLEESSCSSRRQFSLSLPHPLRSSLPSLSPPPLPSPIVHEDEEPNDPDNLPWITHQPLIPAYEPSGTEPSSSDLVPPSSPFDTTTPTFTPSTSSEAAPSPNSPRTYTPSEAAKSLSELKLRIDRLVEASNGDLDVAENALERLASDLGKEKDEAVNGLPGGKRKPSFAPDTTLGRKEVQAVMDGWEMELEKAIVLAMHPRSKRFSDATREYLTKTIHGIFILSPARVASLITRTAMTLILERTSALGSSTFRKPSFQTQPGSYLDPDESHVRNLRQLLTGGEVTDQDLQIEIDAIFDLDTVELASAFAEQLTLEYLYAQGALKVEQDAGVRMTKPSSGKKIDEGLAVLAERDKLAENLVVKEEGLSVGRKREDDIHLGAELITLVLDVWSLRSIGLEARPFTHRTEVLPPTINDSHKAFKLLRPNIELVKLLINAAPEARFMARDLPMLAPPRLWPTEENGLDRSLIGGYHLRRTGIVKKMNRVDRKQAITNAMKSGEMDEILEAVNIISGNKWNVRSPVLKVILAAVDPENFIEETTNNSTKMDHLSAIRNLVKTTHLLPLNIARAFEGHDFYLPHNLDYRGRIYSLSPYLHPCGDDFSRGLLTFGDKKKLGKDGLWWLKIHLSGVYGEDKISFEDRVAWVDARMEDVLASARDPIHNNWWLHGDKGFQTLAACFEIADAYNSPNHEEFESSLPVHMDGTCNGLQYYAALGRDVKGGKSVNLLPSDLPQDVYGEVLTIVKETVAQNLDEKWEDLRAYPWLLARKTVKTTVMTSVYGVTQVGAELQVKAALVDLVAAEREKGTIGPDELDANKIFQISKDLAHLILRSIDKLFPVATSIQEWLGTCLQLVVKAGASSKSADDKEQNSMEWKSPLGLPIVQAYRELRSKAVTTRLQSVSILDLEYKGDVSPLEEKNGFAPNYIHSLDATHLFMTAKACHAQGVTFGSVHDSFWTHAASVPVLNATLREQFVRLHSSDPAPLELLRNQLLERFGEEYIDPAEVGKIRSAWAKQLDGRAEHGVEDDHTAPWPMWALESNPPSKAGARIQLKHVLPPLPSTGDLDIEQVKNSRYFFK